MASSAAFAPGKAGPWISSSRGWAFGQDSVGMPDGLQRGCGKQDWKPAENRSVVGDRMDDRIEGAGTMQLLNPDLGLRDIERVVAFRIT